MTIQRQMTVDVQITPQELAAAFCDMNSFEQAEFFAEIWSIAATWPGNGLCQQSHDIMRVATKGTLDAIETLASHLPADTLRRMADNA